MNDEGDCRTAPATPGLLNITVHCYRKAKYIRDAHLGFFKSNFLNGFILSGFLFTVKRRVGPFHFHTYHAMQYSRRIKKSSYHLLEALQVA